MALLGLSSSALIMAAGVIEEKSPAKPDPSAPVPGQAGQTDGSGVFPLEAVAPETSSQLVPSVIPATNPDGGVTAPEIVSPAAALGAASPPAGDSAGGVAPDSAAAINSSPGTSSDLVDRESANDLEQSGAAINPFDFLNSQTGVPLTGGLGGRPSGFVGNSMGLPMSGAMTDYLPGRLNFSASLTGFYSTNPSQGYASTENAGQGDFCMTLGGGLGYFAKSAEWSYGVTYSGGYNEYFSQAELSGYNQSAAAIASYHGGPLSASFSLGFGYGSGANRDYAAVVNELSVSYGLNASYRISPKTSITTNFSTRLTSASDGGASDTGSFEAGIGASWRYSPLLDFGPGVRYTYTAGDIGESRASIGPTLSANYKLSSKVSLNSQVGLNFAEYENGESADPSISTSIALNYKASTLWGMTLGLYRDVQADPGAAGQFSEVTSLRVGYNRKIRRAVWNVGVSYESGSSQAPESIGGASPNRNYVSFDTSLGMPVFANTCSAGFFFNYSDQGGAAANQRTDSFSVGFSISRSF
jgi:hypothetical protein